MATIDLEAILADDPLLSEEAMEAEAGNPTVADLQRLLAKLRPCAGPMSPLSVGLVFVAGLLLGWLVIGWWLWPVQWAGCGPWDLQPPHQQRYIRLVASEHWQTGDAAQARADLAGWSEAELAALLPSMEREVTTSEQARQLSALWAALALPSTTPSLWGTLFRQQPIVWSVAVAVLLLAAALALAVLPRFGGAAHVNRQGAPVEELEIVPTWLEALSDINEEGVDTPLLAGVLQAEERSADEAQTRGTRPDGSATPLAATLIRTIIPADGPDEEQAGLQELEAREEDEEANLLSDLFGGDTTTDRRIEALARVTRHVSAAGVERQSAVMLADLRRLSQLAQRQKE